MRAWTVHARAFVRTKIHVCSHTNTHTNTDQHTHTLKLCKNTACMHFDLPLVWDFCLCRNTNRHKHTGLKRLWELIFGCHSTREGGAREEHTQEIESKHGLKHLYGYTTWNYTPPFFWFFIFTEKFCFGAATTRAVEGLMRPEETAAGAPVEK